MNFMLSITKFITFKPIIKFKKFEGHNYAVHRPKSQCSQITALLSVGPSPEREKQWDAVCQEAEGRVDQMSSN